MTDLRKCFEYSPLILVKHGFNALHHILLHPLVILIGPSLERPNPLLDLLSQLVHFLTKLFQPFQASSLLSPILAFRLGLLMVISVQLDIFDHSDLLPDSPDAVGLGVKSVVQV
jgi:hypothetical protein